MVYLLFSVTNDATKLRHTSRKQLTLEVIIANTWVIWLKGGLWGLK